MCVPHPELPSPPYLSGLSQSTGFGSLIHNKPIFNMNLPLKTKKDSFITLLQRSYNARTGRYHLIQLPICCLNLLLAVSWAIVLCSPHPGTGNSLLKVKDTYFVFPRDLVMICLLLVVASRRQVQFYSSDSCNSHMMVFHIFKYSSDFLPRFPFQSFSFLPLLFKSPNTLILFLQVNFKFACISQVQH